MNKPDFKGFVNHIIECGWEGDIDWRDIQEMGIQFGLLKEVEMKEPCGEVCSCRKYGVDFPTTCYRKTYE